MLPQINKMTKDCILSTAQLYLQMPYYVHTINILRWFAQFRNYGEFNKDSYRVAMLNIHRIKQKLDILNEEIKKSYPTAQIILRAMLNKDLDQEIEVNPWEDQNDPEVSR